MMKLLDKMYYKLAKRKSVWYCRYLRSKGVKIFFWGRLSENV